MSGGAVDIISVGVDDIFDYLEQLLAVVQRLLGFSYKERMIPGKRSSLVKDLDGGCGGWKLTQRENFIRSFAEAGDAWILHGVGLVANEVAESEGNISDTWIHAYKQTVNVRSGQLAIALEVMVRSNGLLDCLQRDEV